MRDFRCWGFSALCMKLAHGYNPFCDYSSETVETSLSSRAHLLKSCRMLDEERAADGIIARGPDSELA